MKQKLKNSTSIFSKVVTRAKEFENKWNLPSLNCHLIENSELAENITLPFTLWNNTEVKYTHSMGSLTLIHFLLTKDDEYQTDLQIPMDCLFHS